jgi:hypothetical protein
METGTEARRGIGPAWVAVALGVLVALALAVTSRSEDSPGRPPLEFGKISQLSGGDDAVLLGVEVRNVGERTVEVLDAMVPDVADARFGTGTPSSTVTIAGATSGRFLLRIPAPCPGTPTFDRLELRYSADGNEGRQTVRLGGPVRVACR